MSPSAFEHQVSDLVSHLLTCREHCDRILANRRISREHGNLDNLRAVLKTCSNSVWFEFNALRNLFGSRMDRGDETARHSLRRNMRELQFDVEERLYDIASRRVDGPAGFKDMFKRVERIEERVKTAMVDLGQRLSAGPAYSAPKPILIPIPPKVKKVKVPRGEKIDGAIVSVNEVGKLRGHMMNSWEETLIGNTVLYVNCYDRRKTQWVRPDGYIKPLPPTAVPVRAPVWQQPLLGRELVIRNPLDPYRIR